MSICYHHPNTELLLNFAAGNLTGYPKLLVEVHAKVCDCCQQTIQQLEAIGGESLQEMPPAKVGEDAFNSLMNLIHNDEVDPVGSVEQPGSTSKDSKTHQTEQHDIEKIVSNIILGKNVEPLNWHWRTKRFAEIPLSANDEEFEAKLIYFKKGMKVPKHTHGKSEVTLVLKGAFSDADGTYRRGDFITRNQTDEHSPVAESDCICLAVTDAPLKFTGTMGPVLNWMFK